MQTVSYRVTGLLFEVEQVLSSDTRVCFGDGGQQLAWLLWESETVDRMHYAVVGGRRQSVRVYSMSTPRR